MNALQTLWDKFTDKHPETKSHATQGAPVDPLAVFVPRAPNGIWRGPEIKVGEYAANDHVHATVHGFDGRLPQSQVPCRPSRHDIVFFLKPSDDYIAMGEFLMGDERWQAPPRAGVPPGRLSVEDQRRNVARPDAISYGESVGELDGYAPYGLE